MEGKKKLKPIQSRNAMELLSFISQDWLNDFPNVEPKKKKKIKFQFIKMGKNIK